MTRPIVIHWFRRDLRISDNPALVRAAETGRVLPVYVFDDVNAGAEVPGAASRWWLHHSLASLDKDLRRKLACFHGDAVDILPRLARDVGACAVSWNRCYEPWQIERDNRLARKLEAMNVDVFVSNGSLLWEPWIPVRRSGEPYRVFTPFYRNGCLGSPPPREPLPRPERLEVTETAHEGRDSLGLLPKVRWDRKLATYWDIGEAAAQEKLRRFLGAHLHQYADGRDFPGSGHTSRLSPHLHHGEISPNQVWYAAQNHRVGNHTERFLTELVWREFCYSQLYHFPDLPRANWHTKFDRFPWRSDKTTLEQWQRGLTGYPIVDAGMRELWETGYMHNRVRMIVASFLVKNLLVHWREGARWFLDCLVDADLANNSAGWQWVAGSGADGMPYFRIFNPVTQGEKFDRDGAYTRRFVPELGRLPARFLFKPWQAPRAVLEGAGITLGRDYPEPIVDLKASRESALAAFDAMRGGK